MRPLLAAALAAALAAPSSPGRVIRVDVFASDAHGRFVSGLTAADFELREDGVPKAIDSVTFVRAAGGTGAGTVASPREEAAEPADRGRAFGVFLDDYHLTSDGAARARSLLEPLVVRDLGPRDLVAVMKPLDSLFSIRATHSLDALREALAGLQGRRDDFEPRSAFERNYLAGDRGRIAAARAQITLSALNALVVHLGGLSDGRKTLVFVSEGLTPPALRRGFEPMPTLETIIRSANRYNVSVYVVDPGAADGEEPPLLRRLATETDGAAIGSGLHSPEELARMTVDASRYYLVSYRSVQPSDGRFRAIEIRVRKAGVRVRAREGYWALFPDEALAAELASGRPAPEPPVPPEFNRPRKISRLIQPWFGFTRGPSGRTEVTFVWEPVRRIPGDRSRQPAPAQIVLKALAADGTIVFDGRVRASDAADAPAAKDPARAVFDVLPGRLRLHMSIEDGSAGPLDADVRDIEVRDLKAPVTLGTPQVLRARTALELRALVADPDAVPVAARDFSRTETLLIRVAAYAPDGAPQVTARLLSRFGQAIRPLRVTSASADRPFEITLPLAPFVPGDYVIELTAANGSKVVRDLLDFRVRGS